MSVGKVRTVLGDIDPGALGPTMMHEHLLITFGRWLIENGEEFDWFEAFGWDRTDPRATEPMRWETSAFARRRGHPQNFLLDDVDLAVVGAKLVDEVVGERGLDLLLEELGVAVGVEVGLRVPDADGETGVRLVEVVGEPAAAQPRDAAADRLHGLAVGLGVLGPHAGLHLAPRDSHDHGAPPSLRV